jgi:signal peptidase I
LDKFVVREMSMAPTLLPGDRLLASARLPAVGRIVVLPHPGTPTTLLVKRMIAGPGWHIRISDTHLEVTTPRGSGMSMAIPAEHRPRAWALADDEMFVLSDALDRTRADSRSFGPVPLDGVLTAVCRYLPVRRWSRL